MPNTYMKKMFIIISHLGNANKNHTLLSTHKDDLNQKIESVSKEMKKLEHTLVI